MEMKTASKLHELASHQAWGFHGFTLSHKEFHFLETEIREGRSLMLQKLTNTYTAHLVKWEKMPIIVMYDKKRHCIESVYDNRTLESWLKQRSQNRRIFDIWMKKKPNR